METERELREFEFFRDLDLTNRYDSLTRLLNRDVMMEYVRWLIEKGHQFSFYLIDIDNFKNVNDTYGHLVGDAIISKTAHEFIQICGNEGIVARYGGDEFVIVFDGVHEYQDVWNHARSLTHFNLGSLEEYGIPNLQITVSVGIARFPLDASKYEDLFGIADKALYRAKSKGRHCFIIYLAEKHANLSIQGERGKRLMTMQICNNLFNNLTACGEDLSSAITSIFRGLVSCYMFDHICVENTSKMNFSVIYPLSRQKFFRYIPHKLISTMINSAGYAAINSVDELNKNSFPALIAECKDQKISSILFVRIAAYGKEYGYIRVDATSSNRIWQNEEISMVIVAANYIALILHYQGKSLSDLPAAIPIEAGTPDTNK